MRDEVRTTHATAFATTAGTVAGAGTGAASTRSHVEDNNGKVLDRLEYLIFTVYCFEVLKV